MFEEKKGFEGLSELVSDINKMENFDNMDLERKFHKKIDENKSDNLKREQKGNESKSEDLNIKTDIISNQNENVESNKSIDKNSNEKKKYKIKYFLLIIILCFSVYIIFNKKSYEISSESNYEYSTLKKNIDLEYTLPPIGKSNILSIQQIRWCERQRIRIETLKNYVRSNFGINTVNNLIDDFNNRCSSFKYRNNDLTQANREVEQHREEIVQEAIDKARYYDNIDQTSNSISRNPVENTISPSLTQTELIRETQKLLIELGYYPGSIDGKFGEKTLIAIKLYKKDAQLSPPFNIDENLISQLNKSIEVYKKLISSNSTQKLSKAEYRYLIKNSKEFRTATNKLNFSWKKIENSYDKENYSILFQEQNEWIESGRDLDAEKYINSGFDRKKAYTLATNNRTNLLNDIIFKIKLSQEEMEQNTDNKIHKRNLYSPTQQTKSSNYNQMSYEDQSRYNAAIRLQRLGYNIDWRNTSLGNILDIESRINVSQRLQRFGYNFDWRNISLGNLLDIESRINVSHRLQKLGYNIDWRNTSLGSLLDIESRISAAQRLKKNGKNVDWRNYSIYQLLNMELRN